MTRIEYLLTCLAEEAAEVAQRATKASRFGTEEIQPGKTFTNAERIGHEMTDLVAVVEMLEAEGVRIYYMDVIGIERKKEKVEKFYDYAIQCGTVQLAQEEEK